MNKLPIARTDDIVVQETGKELLIYDLITNKAYHLNETSRIVFEACDGKTSFGELKRKYLFTDEIIYLTLNGLNKDNLLDQNAEYCSPFVEMSRRDVIKKVAWPQ